MTDLSPGERGHLSSRSTAGSSPPHSLRLVDDTTIRFGRGDACEVRIGHAPAADPEIPLLAGWLVMAHGRVLVEAAPCDNGTDGTAMGADARAVRALQVSAAGGPPVPLAAGSVYSPATHAFTVEIVGALDTWTLDVVARPRSHDLTERQADGIPIDLTDDQRTVLLAYAEPVLAGGVEPATHDQVAAKVSMSRSQVRRHLDRVSSEFYDKRLWSPDSGDTRVRVVEAARHNRPAQRRPELTPASCRAGRPRWRA